MIKKLTKHGNSWAVVIEKPVLDLLNIDKDTEFKVSTDGKRLWLEPIHEASGKTTVHKSREHGALAAR